VKFILVIGFFYAMLDHATWGDGHRQQLPAGRGARQRLGSALMPGDMFSTAVDFTAGRGRCFDVRSNQIGCGGACWLFG
jgi:hypothetical protein